MRRIIFFSILIIILSVIGYSYWFYYNPYSDGYRQGVLQKFSRKGNVFKTYEGEVIQLGFGQRTGGGFSAQYFNFSVTDMEVADSLESCLDKSVKVHYIQYRRSLPWRGEEHSNDQMPKGQYVVDAIIEVEEVQKSY